MDLSLYLVASRGRRSDENFLNFIKEAVRGGVSIVQLREKMLCTKDFYELALKTKKLCDELQIPLLINDRLDIALAVNAAGVHLGQDDFPLRAARKLLGLDKIIGLSVREKAQLDFIEGADYLGCGAIKATPTKDSKIIGIEGLREIASLSPLPVVAIGGVDDKIIKEFKDIKLAGIAVVRAIMDSEKPYDSALSLKKEFKKLHA